MIANKECPREKADIRNAPSAPVRHIWMWNGKSSSNGDSGSAVTAIGLLSGARYLK